MSQKIYIATWEHRHGTESRAFHSEESALAWKSTIAKENWALETILKPPADISDGDLATEYFAIMGDRGDRGEWFDVQESELYD